jgi:catechol 2,3-dioxygenase-like lactoylglutathione lyase family enzyme
MPVPRTGIVATHFVVAGDIEATARFYSEVLGGEVVWRGAPRSPTYVKFANIWIGINAGGGPPPDKLSCRWGIVALARGDCFSRGGRMDL